MATIEDVARLIHEVKGQAEVEAMRRTLEMEVAELTKLDAALAKGTISQQQYAQWTARATQAAEAQAAALLNARQGMSAVGVGASNAAYKAQVFAQAFDDLQYVPEQGLRPILNNLVQINPVLGTVAVGASILLTAWKPLMELFNQGATQTEAERMEELGKKTHKTAEETKQLNDYKREQAEIEAVAAGRSAAQKDMAAAVQAAFDEGGGERIAAQLGGARTAAGTGAKATDEQARRLEVLKEQMAFYVKGGAFEAAGRERTGLAIIALTKEIEDQVKQENLVQAKVAMLQAKADPAKLEALIREMDRAGVGGGVLFDLEAARPEAVAAKQALEVQGDINRGKIEKGMREGEAKMKRELRFIDAKLQEWDRNDAAAQQDADRRQARALKNINEDADANADVMDFNEREAEKARKEAEKARKDAERDHKEALKAMALGDFGTEIVQNDAMIQQTADNIVRSMQDPFTDLQTQYHQAMMQIQWAVLNQQAGMRMQQQRRNQDVNMLMQLQRNQRGFN